MSSKLDVKKAISILKREGYKVRKINRRKYLVDYGCGTGDEWEFTPEELISMARHYTSEDKGRSSSKGSLKHYDHRKDRNATRQAIREERYEDIPANAKVKPENPWNWD